MSNKDDFLIQFKYFEKENTDLKIGKPLGRGGFGAVRNIIINKKEWAGKLIEKKTGQKSEEEKYGVVLRGKNIVNITKILSSKIGQHEYNLIIMEKAALRDLGKLNEFLYKHNLLKLIYNPFYEIIEDNLLRFYTKQIINALELLDRNYYVHNDIKPENILVGLQLVIKLTDFSLLRKVKDQKTKIPGGTQGYLSPEYYINKDVNSEIARKQDYFALGSTLYLLKYGKSMLNYKRYSDDEKIIIAEEIVKLLEQSKDNIKSGKMSDGKFIDFLCSLIDYEPEDRPSFEEIYRNIWLNKNLEQINNISSIHQGDEEKMIMELQKSGHLIKKEKEYEQDINSENENEQKSKKNKYIKKDKNKLKSNRLCRFRFKKKP